MLTTSPIVRRQHELADEPGEPAEPLLLRHQQHAPAGALQRPDGCRTLQGASGDGSVQIPVRALLQPGHRHGQALAAAALQHRWELLAELGQLRALLAPCRASRAAGSVRGTSNDKGNQFLSLEVRNSLLLCAGQWGKRRMGE